MKKGEVFASLILPLAKLKGRYSPMALVTDPVTKNCVYPWRREIVEYMFLTGIRKRKQKRSAGSAASTFGGEIATNDITLFWQKPKRMHKSGRST